MQEISIEIAMHNFSIQLKVQQLSGKHTAMSFISLSFSIIVDLFAAKIAGYTFMWTTYETETSTYLWTVNARIFHWNPVADRSI